MKSKTKEIVINTLFDGETTLYDCRPNCYFYPWLKCGILNEAGHGEKYRTIPYKGHRVHVSEKYHKEVYLPNRRLEKETEKESVLDLTSRMDSV